MKLSKLMFLIFLLVAASGCGDLQAMWRKCCCGCCGSEPVGQEPEAAPEPVEVEQCFVCHALYRDVGAVFLSCGHHLCQRCAYKGGRSTEVAGACPIGSCSQAVTTIFHIRSAAWLARMQDLADDDDAEPLVPVIAAYIGELIRMGHIEAIRRIDRFFLGKNERDERHERHVLGLAGLGLDDAAFDFVIRLLVSFNIAPWVVELNLNGNQVINLPQLFAPEHFPKLVNVLTGNGALIQEVVRRFPTLRSRDVRRSGSGSRRNAWGEST